MEYEFNSKVFGKMCFFTSETRSLVPKLRNRVLQDSEESKKCITLISVRSAFVRNDRCLRFEFYSMEQMSSGEQEVFSLALSVIKESITVRPMAKGLPGELFVL